MSLIEANAVRKRTDSSVYSLSLHDALPIYAAGVAFAGVKARKRSPHDRRIHVAADDRIDHGPLRLRLRVIPVHRSEEHTSELQSRFDIVCRPLLEKKKAKAIWKRTDCSVT